MWPFFLACILSFGTAHAAPAVYLEYERKFGKGIERDTAQTNYPSGVAIAPEGDFFVTDLLNNRVKHYSPEGQFLHQWLCPQGLGLTVDPRNGVVWVAMWKSHTVQAYSPTGILLTTIGTSKKSGSEAGQFNGPHDVSIDPTTGDLYVLDSGNQRVQVFQTQLPIPRKISTESGDVDWSKFWRAVFVSSFDGELTSLPGSTPFLLELPQTIAEVSQISERLKPSDYTPEVTFSREFSLGDSDRSTQFVNPFGISVHPDGEFLVVANTGQREIVKFSPEGEVLARWGGPDDPAVLRGKEGPPIGSKAGEFRRPRGVAVDREGFIYVADTDNDRVQKLTSNGDFVSFLVGPNDRQSGSFHPRAVDVHPETGDVVAAASFAHRLDRFDRSGRYLSSFGKRDSTTGYFSQIKGIAIDSEEGMVYLSDWMDHRIRSFDKNGFFLGSMDGWIADQHMLDGSALPAGYDTDPESLMWSVKEHQAFPGPLDLDAEGNIWWIRGSAHYVDDPRQEATWLVRCVSPSGEFISGFGHPSFPRNARLRGIAIDREAGHVFISNTEKNSVMKFEMDGTLIWEKGSKGSGSEQLNFPTGLAIDQKAGRLYVVDSYNYRVQVLDLEGRFLESWGEKGSGPGQFLFDAFNGLAVDERGNLYVSDSKNHRVQVLDSTGKPVTEFGQKRPGGVMHYGAIPDVEVHDGQLYVLDSARGRVEVHRIEYAD